MAGRQRLWLNLRKVDFWNEQPYRGVHVVYVDDELTVRACAASSSPAISARLRISPDRTCSFSMQPR